MKRIFITICSLTVMINIFGCAGVLQEIYYITPSAEGYNQVCASWEGADVSDLLRSWGPPVQTTPMPNGHTMYTYRKESRKTTDIESTTTYNEYAKQYETRQSGGDTIVLWCSTTFEVDENQKIVFWRYEGNRCLAAPNRPS